ncbi:MAG: TolC family protein [Ghiorsea sp.]|nr:TolC family protein [Ghiorsea sp.]
MKNKIIILWSCVLLATPAIAADAPNLNAAVALALEHTPSLQAAQAARDASVEDVSLGRAWLLPSVVVTGSLTRINQDFNYNKPSAFLSPTVRNREQDYGIRISQPLFDVAKWAMYKQGSISAATGEVKLAIQRQRTILEASAAWLDVMRAQAAYAAAIASEKAMDRLATQAKAAFDVGTAAVNDSLSASSRRDLAKAGRIRAGQVLAQAKARLNSLVGKPLDVSVALHQDIKPLHAMPDALKIWEQRAEVNALGVRLSSQGIAIADAAHLQAVGTAMPNVQLVAGWNHNKSSDSTFGGSTVKAAYIGVELSMPLYAGGATWAKARKSSKQKLQAEFNLAEAKRTARLEARQAWLSVRTTAAEVAALDAALNSAKVEKDAMQVSFEVGLRTMTEALDAQERFASAQQRYADVVARHAMAYLQLMAATGDLNNTSVAMVNTTLFSLER